jgi:F420-0:gamma-glutamyl ligase-like protein
MITDSDKTFSLKGIHFSSRPTFVKRIYNIGPIAYIIGRFLKMRARSTPIAISKNIEVEEALRISAISNKARKFGAGRTAWDVATRFGTKMTEVSWDMLKNCEHRPIVIVRKLID